MGHSGPKESEQWTALIKGLEVGTYEAEPQTAPSKLYICRVGKKTHKRNITEIDADIVDFSAWIGLTSASIKLSNIFHLLNACMSNLV